MPYDIVKIDSSLFMKTLSLEKMNLISSCERHYNILSDQFGSDVFFDSVIPFGINFNQNGFFIGNEIEACDLLEEPKFEIEATEDDLFTLVISSLDSNYLSEQSNNEVLHYGISNIKKIVTNTGHSFTFNRWAHYFPPIPAKGSGMTFIYIDLGTYRSESVHDFLFLVLDRLVSVHGSHD